MAKRVPPDVDARIVTLRKAHRTTPDIAAILCREGHSITPSGVRRVLSRLGLGAPRKTREAQKGVPHVAQSARAPRKALPVSSTPKPALPDEAGGDDPDVDVQGTLRRSLGSLERAAEAAELDKDVGRIVSAQRAIGAVAALLQKLQPPAPIDVDESPDMILAATRGRERLHATLDRLLEGSAS